MEKSERQPYQPSSGVASTVSVKSKSPSRKRHLSKPRPLPIKRKIPDFPPERKQPPAPTNNPTSPKEKTKVSNGIANRSLPSYFSEKFIARQSDVKNYPEGKIPQGKIKTQSNKMSSCNKGKTEVTTTASERVSSIVKPAAATLATLSCSSLQSGQKSQTKKKPPIQKQLSGKIGKSSPSVSTKHVTGSVDQVFLPNNSKQQHLQNSHFKKAAAAKSSKGKDIALSNFASQSASKTTDKNLPNQKQPKENKKTNSKDQTLPTVHKRSSHGPPQPKAGMVGQHVAANSSSSQGNGKQPQTKQKTKVHNQSTISDGKASSNVPSESVTGLVGQSTVSNNSKKQHFQNAPGKKETQPHKTNAQKQKSVTSTAIFDSISKGAGKTTRKNPPIQKELKEKTHSKETTLSTVKNSTLCVPPHPNADMVGHVAVKSSTSPQNGKQSQTKQKATADNQFPIRKGKTSNKVPPESVTDAAGQTALSKTSKQQYLQNAPDKKEPHPRKTAAQKQVNVTATAISKSGSQGASKITINNPLNQKQPKENKANSKEPTLSTVKKSSSHCPPQPKAGIPQPKAGIPQPKAGIPQPKAGIPQPKAGIPQPKAGIPQPKAGIPQPKAGIPQPKAGTVDHHVAANSSSSLENGKQPQTKQKTKSHNQFPFGKGKAATNVPTESVTGFVPQSVLSNNSKQHHLQNAQGKKETLPSKTVAPVVQEQNSKTTAQKQKSITATAISNSVSQDASQTTMENPPNQKLFKETKENCKETTPSTMKTSSSPMRSHSSQHGRRERRRRYTVDADTIDTDIFDVTSTTNSRFRHDPVFPTDEDLTVGHRAIPINKVKGAYTDLDQYGYVQYTLLKEDFLGPLRDGIEEYRRTGTSNLTLKVFEEVHVVESIHSEDGVCHKLQLDSAIMKDNWFKRGALVTLTPDNFKNLENILFAIVCHTSDHARHRSQLTIKFSDLDLVRFQTPKFGFTRTYTLGDMPKNFFEPYNQVLQALKMTTQLPFQRLILMQERKCGKPAYVKSSTQYDLSGLTPSTEDNGTLSRVTLLGRNWPSSDDLHLDPSQYDALKASLTKELVIIQGPPGTGKTFIGLKIAKALFDNRRHAQTQGNVNKTQVQNVPLSWCNHIRCRYDPSVVRFEEKLMEKLTKPAKSQLTGVPVLVICYTNHALDQFLEGILEFCPTGIVRIGSRSKSEVLDEFNIKEWRRQNHVLSYMYRSTRRELIGKMKQATSSCGKASFIVRSCHRGIVKVKVLAPFMNTQHKIQIENAFSGKLHPNACLMVWLSESEEYEFTKVKFQRGDSLVAYNAAVSKTTNEIFKFGAGHKVEEVEYDCPGLSTKFGEKQNGINVESMYSRSKPLADLFTENPSNEHLGHTRHNSTTAFQKGPVRQNMQTARAENGDDSMDEDSDSEDELPDEFYEQMCQEAHSDFYTTIVIKDLTRVESINGDDNPETIQRKQAKRHSTLKKIHRGKIMSEAESERVDDIWALSKEERWSLYRVWVTKLIGQSSVRDPAGCKDYNDLCDSLKKLRSLKDMAIMKSAQFVGMTTTGAARYWDVLQKLQPKIIIVEEAAEVLEAHIISALSPGCQHLILIGDHKQLRPNPNVYELKMQFNLDVSMFERMSDYELTTLQVQHRMRPDISRNMRCIYDCIQDHESVLTFPEVSGMAADIFFLKHTCAETEVAGLNTYQNKSEAKFCVLLSQYLIAQGYTKDQITILTTYAGQVLLLKQMVSLLPEDRQVFYTTVDNFQGEQNYIIILSLVRSNGKGVIGFIKEENRICVALSRAKYGLYVIGDFDLLQDKSGKWREIIDGIESCDSPRAGIGDKLPLLCPQHQYETFISVKYAVDFNKISDEGGCGESCGNELICGHVCERMCHGDDRDHQLQTRLHPCQKPCERVLSDCEHNCNKLCYENCWPCIHPTEKYYPECMHSNMILCCQRPVDVECMKQCEKSLGCGHPCEERCGSSCTAFCKVQCLRELPCQHETTLCCGQDVRSYDCQEPVKRTLKCHHVVSLPCHMKDEDWKCLELVTKQLTCGHWNNLVCHEDPSSFPCSTAVVHDLPCGHKQKVVCGKEPMPCQETVLKNLPCHHEGFMPCSQDTGSFKCKEEVLKLLPCGHSTTLHCFMDIELHQCQEKSDLPCGHEVQPPVKCYEKGTYQCMTQDEIELSCAHKLQGPCHELKSDPKCKRKVPCKLPCGHVVSLLCHQDSDMYRCTEKCQQQLLCGHTCTGQCHQCFQGKLHIPCQMKCSNILRCGHRCVGKCSEFCSPCRYKKCSTQCEHRKCALPCMAPCRPCKEPCSWRCRHHSCSQPCFEPCVRPPCNKPCRKEFLCRKCRVGHKCYGLCGEACIDVCLSCDEGKIRRYFQGNFNSADRYILLPDCKHCFEVKYMDQYMFPSEDEPIVLRKCPRCDVPIQTASRYGYFIKYAMASLSHSKSEIYGNKSDIAARKSKLQDLVTRNSRYLRISQFGEAFHEQVRLYTAIGRRQIPLTGLRLTGFQVQLKLLEAISSLREMVKEGILLSQLDRLESFVFHRDEPLTNQMHSDAEIEIDRLHMCISVNIMIDNIHAHSEQYHTVKQIGRQLAQEKLDGESLKKLLQQLNVIHKEVFGKDLQPFFH